MVATVVLCIARTSLPVCNRLTRQLLLTKMVRFGQGPPISCIHIIVFHNCRVAWFSPKLKVYITPPRMTLRTHAEYIFSLVLSFITNPFVKVSKLTRPCSQPWPRFGMQLSHTCSGRTMKTQAVLSRTCCPWPQWVRLTAQSCFVTTKIGPHKIQVWNILARRLKQTQHKNYNPTIWWLTLFANWKFYIRIPCPCCWLIGFSVL